MGKGVAAVIVGGALIACLLSGMAWQQAAASRDSNALALAGVNAQLSQERSRHEQAEAELRGRFETAERESRMAEYYILELDGKLMAGGFIPPSRGYGQWKKEHAK